MPVQQAPAAKVRRKQSAGEEKTTDFNIGTPAVCGDVEEHFEVSREQGNGYGRRKKWASHTAIFCMLTNGSDCIPIY